jgi:uncharacterized membrane protein YhiD involved in acid resistance
MNIEENVLEKGQIEREHMDRVSLQMAAEEDALKSSRIVRGIDTKVYKNRKYRYIPRVKKELSDKMKLNVMRMYQFLVGLMGFIGVGVIFLGIDEPVLHLSISEDLVIEIELILLGCALALAGVVGIIGFQHKHDKISDRISSEQHTRKRTI